MQPKLIAAFILVVVLSACAPGKPFEAPTPVPPSPTAKSIPTSTSVPDTATPLPSPSPTTPMVSPKTAPPQFQQYLGIKPDPLPEGVESIGGGLFTNNERFVLELVRKGNDLMLWLETGKVLDILYLEDFQKDEIIYAMGCKQNSVEDPEIIAIGDFTHQVWLTRYATNETIRRAYRANLKDGAFSSIPTTGIECSAELGFDPNDLTNAKHP